VLVLFDELGAGTDPDEGSALARSILTYLLDRRVPTVATTHYSELKAFAHETAGAVNASVAFDVESLSPTYELEIGLPGRSNALAIAERLGLDPRIIRGARAHLGTAGVRMEGLLRDLEQERDAAADEREQLALERRAVEDMRLELKRERQGLEEERASVVDEARSRARRELDAVVAELAEVRAQARREDLTRSGVEELRRRARRIEDKIAPATGQAVKRDPPAEAVEPLDGRPEVGDVVRVASLGQVGELLSLSADGSQAEVLAGSLRLRVGVDDLQRVTRRESGPERLEDEPARSVVVMRSADRARISQQLDMRGWRVEDALPELESYLNDAVMSGLSWVRIIHGRGTGALRAAVREHLAGHPLVQSSAPAPASEGGDGVTIVRLSA